VLLFKKKYSFAAYVHETLILGIKTEVPPMKMKLSLLLLIIVFPLSCQTVPITGRQQLSLIPSDTILGMSFQSYDEFLSKNKAITNTQESQMVKRVDRGFSTQSNNI
jgi:hypothetical protein